MLSGDAARGACGRRRACAHAPGRNAVCYPLPAGEVSLSYDGSQMRVSSSGAGGLLYLDKKLYDVRDSADAAEGNWLVFRIADGEERRLSAGKR